MAKKAPRRIRRSWLRSVFRVVAYTVAVFGAGAALGFWAGRTFSLKVGYTAGRAVEKVR